MTDRLIIRDIGFIGPSKHATLPLQDGLNVLWGASNTGKSFFVKSMDFMFGAGSDRLPGIRERDGYDAVWLSLDLPKTGRVTLKRAIAGGDFAFFLGDVPFGSEQAPDYVLSSTHKESGSLSGLLLNEIGVSSNHKIAQDLYGGVKPTFSFRHFSPYIFTDETAMISEQSPIRMAHHNDTLEKNMLKFILTGVDDAAMVVADKPEKQKDINRGKLEMVDELIEMAEAELQRYPEPERLQDQDDALDVQLGSLSNDLRARQEQIDALSRQRRELQNTITTTRERALSLSVSVENFRRLEAVFDSDIERLEAIDEGGSILLASRRRPCPMCGADPESQRHTHGFDEIELSRRAAELEVFKIRRQRRDLSVTMEALAAELSGLDRSVTGWLTEFEDIEQQIKQLTPQEGSLRERFETLQNARELVRAGLAIIGRIADLRARKAALVKFKARRAKREEVTVGVSGPVGHELAMQVQAVLTAWKFPGLEGVAFDLEHHDIAVNGALRNANGKGVRGLMNAAFKIGVMNMCRERQLPHPGILVLDSPLLSYRDPHSRHGDLAPDEILVKQSGVKDNFYAYVAELAKDAQIVIVENDRPSAQVPADRITVFAGSQSGGGRSGLL